MASEKFETWEAEIENLRLREVGYADASKKMGITHDPNQIAFLWKNAFV